MNKLYSSLAIITLGLSFGGLTINSATASPLTESRHESNSTLLSQHIKEHTPSNSQVKLKTYMLGRVTDVNDSSVSIRVENGYSLKGEDTKLLSLNPNMRIGRNVLVGVDMDDKYYIISDRQSEWNSILDDNDDVERSLMVRNYLSGEDIVIDTTTQTTSREIEVSSLYDRDEMEMKTTTSIEMDEDDDNMNMQTQPIRGLW